MVVGFVIWSLVAVTFVGIGLSCRKSDKPAGFFAGVEPPQVNDVKGYNRAVSRLWFAAAFVLEGTGIPLLVSKQNAAGIVLMIPVIVIGLIAMMFAYVRIEHRYTKKT